MISGHLEESRVQPVPSPHTARAGYAVLAGLATLLLAWVLIIPPFSRLRLVLVALAVVSLTFPFVTTVWSYDVFGAAWQGRYGRPLAVGLVVLGAYAVDRAGKSIPLPMLLLAGGLFVISQIVSVAHTLHAEVQISPLVDSSSWLQPSMGVAVILSAIGAVLMWSAVLPPRRAGVPNA